MKIRQKKPESAKAVKKTVSMPGAMFLWAEPQARVDGYPTFSDYIQDLIRRDKERRHQAAA